MWYGCGQCGTKVRFWNSRDGVTPFTTQCMSCGAIDLQHVDFRRDVYAPDYQPWPGQPVWTSMTMEKALHYVEQRCARMDEPIDAKTRAAFMESIYNEGQAPDMILWGYAHDPAVERKLGWWPKREIFHDEK